MKAPQTEQARIAAALDKLATVQAALRLWVMSLPEDDAIEAMTADAYQVPLRAIVDGLETGKEVQQDGLDFLFAGGLVSMAEAALWQQMNCSAVGAARVDDLRRTVAMALRHIEKGCKALTALQAEGVAP